MEIFLIIVSVILILFCTASIFIYPEDSFFYVVAITVNFFSAYLNICNLFKMPL